MVWVVTSKWIWLHEHALTAGLLLIQWGVVSGDTESLPEVTLTPWACDIAPGTVSVPTRRRLSSGVVEEEKEGSRNLQGEITWKEGKVSSPGLRCYCSDVP